MRKGTRDRQYLTWTIGHSLCVCLSVCLFVSVTGHLRPILYTLTTPTSPSDCLPHTHTLLITHKRTLAYRRKTNKNNNNNNNNKNNNKTTTTKLNNNNNKRDMRIKAIRLCLNIIHSPFETDLNNKSPNFRLTDQLCVVIQPQYGWVRPVGDTKKDSLSTATKIV